MQRKPGGKDPRAPGKKASDGAEGSSDPEDEFQDARAAADNDPENTASSRGKPKKPPLVKRIVKKIVARKPAPAHDPNEEDDHSSRPARPGQPKKKPLGTTAARAAAAAPRQRNEEDEGIQDEEQRKAPTVKPKPHPLPKKVPLKVAPTAQSAPTTNKPAAKPPLKKAPVKKPLGQTPKGVATKPTSKVPSTMTSTASKKPVKKPPAKPTRPTHPDKPPAAPPAARKSALKKVVHKEEPSPKEAGSLAGDLARPSRSFLVEDEPGPGTPPLVSEELRTLFFRDGRRRIDIVLAYEETANPLHTRYRRIFQQSLVDEGLEVEVEDAADSWDGYTYFVKIHAPWFVLTKYAEQLHYRMPVKKKGPPMAFPKIKIKPGEKPVFPDMKAFESDSVEIEVVKKAPGKKNKLSRFRSPFPYDKKLIPDENEFYNADFVRQREGMYLISDKETFFSQAARSRIAWEVLLRAQYDEAEHERGIYNLLSLQVYLAAYPLHDGPFGKGKFNKATETYTERRILYAEWGRVRCWYKQQPLYLIRRYFGEKVGLYFAWLGFYTSMLILPAFVGVFTSLYGLANMITSVPASETCDRNLFGNLTLCPSCEKHCAYDFLYTKCTITRIISIFDNHGTVGFSVFMSLWATIFIEFWKRQQIVYAWEWSLSNVDTLTEVVNPEYEAKARVYKLNPVTLRYEPHVPFWERIGRVAAANTILVFMLCVVLCTVIGMIGYRIIMVSLLSQSSSWRPMAHILTSASGSLINLCIILSMNRLYSWVATRLTDLERPRTQREYEYSFAFKMFLFTFLNTYSSLIYIAFFKGRFSGYPGHEVTVFGYNLDKCDGGCLYEVFVQLAVIMVGQQTVRTANNVVLPILKAWWRQRKRRLGKEMPEQVRTDLARWEEDFNLEECHKLAPFDEYLDMTIQFGFVTLFVAAFPLAPLFALINNICEIRVDAYRYSKRLRRPIAERAPNIGAWQAILRALARCAVICNAFMIAFTSEFIPRLVYSLRHSKDLSLSGFVNFTLSKFDVDDYDEDARPDNTTLEGTMVRECRYLGFREAPNTDNEYQLSSVFWVITTAQLCFVVVFEHVVFFITSVVAGMIPPMPKSVAQRMKREQIVVQNLIAKLQDQNYEAQSILHG